MTTRDSWLYSISKSSPLATFIATSCLARDLWLFNSRCEPGATVWIFSGITQCHKCLARISALFSWEFSMSCIIVHNYQSNQSALMTRCRTDSRHQYGIFCGESQTSFSQNATRAGSEERLFCRLDRQLKFFSRKSSKVIKITELLWDMELL